MGSGGNGGGRPFRVAAVGDLHFDGTNRERLERVVASARGRADVLLICGDLTTHGTPEQMRGVGEILGRVDTPVVTVLGNHDFDSDAAAECASILSEIGVHVLDGDAVEIDGVGFAGAKGFVGGFGRYTLGAFGERLIKRFVQETIDEALKLENALRRLKSPIKVVALHYAPIEDTVAGEPEPIIPFLGSSRLLQPLETMDADVVFHGHAHSGSPEGRTPSGIPVYNVSLPVLEAQGELVRIWTTRAPERRSDGRPRRGAEDRSRQPL